MLDIIGKRFVVPMLRMVKKWYITIGNFYNNKDIKYEKLKKLANFPGSQRAEAYYFIDQVEVFMIDNLSECDCMNGAKRLKKNL